MSSDQSTPPQQPTALHHDDADEEDDSVKQLGDCSLIYLTLQNCLVKTDRNWKLCQAEVRDLKACNDKRMKASNQCTTDIRHAIANGSSTATSHLISRPSVSKVKLFGRNVSVFLPSSVKHFLQAETSVNFNEEA